MPIYRITFGFAGAEQGWSETHMCFNTSVVPSQVYFGNGVGVAGSIDAVAQARAAFLGREFSLVGTRVSAYSDGGTPPNRVPRSVYLSKLQYATAITTVKGASEPTPVQLEANGQAVQAGIPPQFFGNENTTYLGGPFDDCVTNAGLVLPAVNNLSGLFNSWKQLMIAAGMGWGASVTLDLALPITDIVQNTDGTVTYTTAAPAGGEVLGKSYPARVRGINNGRSPLNRAQIVTYLAGNTWKTKEILAFSTMQSGGFLRVYAQVLQFIPYANITLQLTTIKHKRGKPFFSEPGRAKKQIRG